MSIFSMISFSVPPPATVSSKGYKSTIIKSIDGIKKEDAIYTHFQDGSIKSIAKEKYAKEK